MRILFPDISRPKTAAKLLARVSTGVRLSAAQQAVAEATGYRDWNELTHAPASQGDFAAADADETKRIILSIADRLELAPSDAQYAVARSRLLRREAWSLAEHLKLCTSIWREREFGPARRGKPGTLVKVRAHGETKIAYLRLAGRPSYVLYDSGPGMCADFEVITPRAQLDDFLPSRFWLPYGFWTLRDGSEVIFARDYLPMWRVFNGAVERLDPWLWIEGICETTNFSDQLGTVLWDRGPARDHALSHLARRRIFELPRLVEALPDMIRAGTESMGRSVEHLRQRVGLGTILPSFARLNHYLAYG
jgi:hypothetical protein